MGGPCTVDGVSYDALDNFLQCSFELDGQWWTSAEQYFQAAKFLDPGYREKIRNCHDGDACWNLGNTRQYPIRADWEAVKVEIMYRANKAKFTAEGNEALRDALLSTGSGRIVAHGFPFWAHWNGVLLERIREELRKPVSPNGGVGAATGGASECADWRDEAVLQERVKAMDDYKREQTSSSSAAAGGATTSTASGCMLN